MFMYSTQVCIRKRLNHLTLYDMLTSMSTCVLDKKK